MKQIVYDKMMPNLDISAFEFFRMRDDAQFEYLETVSTKDEDIASKLRAHNHKGHFVRYKGSIGAPSLVFLLLDSENPPTLHLQRV